MSVVFSTYHSIDGVSAPSTSMGSKTSISSSVTKPTAPPERPFDDERESNFVKVHDAEFHPLRETPLHDGHPAHLWGMAKATAERTPSHSPPWMMKRSFGKQLHVITFSEAVELDLLTDYKVIVLTMDAAHVSARIQGLLTSDGQLPQSR